MVILMKYFKLKTLWLGLVLLALGILSGKMEQTYYQYIDANGVLRESWFFPLAIIFLLLGVSTLGIAFCIAVRDYFNRKNDGNSGPKSLDGSLIDRYRFIPKDYSDNPRRFLIVLGACDEMAIEIIASFGFEYEVENSYTGGRAHIVSLLAPIQTIPDVVRALAQKNIGIYQVVLI